MSWRCPGCMPDVDFTRMADLTPEWCHEHRPSAEGSDDRRVTSAGVSGFAEAGGEDNRRWCDLLHRGVRS